MSVGFSVTVIIASYNTVDLLRDCLNNLLSFKKIRPQIIVVDNDSKDGSAQMVEKEFASFNNLKLIKSQNKGIPHAYNKALEFADCDYLLYLGTDAYPKEEVIINLIEALRADKTIGAATPRLMTRDSEPDMDAHRGFPTPWAAITHFLKLNKLFKKSKIFNQYFIGWQDLKTQHEIDLCISHFLLIPKTVSEDVGIWDEDYFVYGEDVDYCFRIKKKGYKIVYFGQYEVLHYKGAGMGRKTAKDIKTFSQTDKTTKRVLKNERARAMRLFYDKHYSATYPRFVTSLVLFGISTLSFLRKVS